MPRPRTVIPQQAVYPVNFADYPPQLAATQLGNTTLQENTQQQQQQQQQSEYRRMMQQQQQPVSQIIRYNMEIDNRLRSREVEEKAKLTYPYKQLKEPECFEYKFLVEFARELFIIIENLSDALSREAILKLRKMVENRMFFVQTMATEGLKTATALDLPTPSFYDAKPFDYELKPKLKEARKMVAAKVHIERDRQLKPYDRRNNINNKNHNSYHGGSNSNNNYNNNSNNNNKNSNSSNNNNNGSFKRTCHICGKSGHFARDCPDKAQGTSDR